MKIKNIFSHFRLVNKHRWTVFKLCLKAGIPFRGLVHDISKYSHAEFWISAKYYNGKHSPIRNEREENGYSTVWCHHKGRNKHHFEYWEDVKRDKRIGVFVPYKYIVESICDKIAAGMVYKGKDWNQKEPLEYWNSHVKNDIIVKHPGSVEFIDIVFKKLSEEGIDNALNSKYLKKLYKQIEKKYNISH